MNLHSMSNLYQRITMGTIASCIAFLAVYLSFTSYWRFFFPMLTAAIAGIALWEFYQIAKAKAYAPLEKIGIASSLLYMAAVFVASNHPSWMVLPEICLLAALAVTFGYFFVRGERPLLNSAVTAFGMIYLTLPLAYLFKINYFFADTQAQDGRWWLLYLLLITKTTDMGAYFFGKNFGRRKLSPYISPSKTWEGACGGIVLALGISMAFSMAVNAQMPPPIQLSLIQACALGFTMAISAQFGDLAESLLKRDGGIKDSNQLPGLGGLLDMVDSVIFTAPLLYFFLKLQ